MAFFDFSCKHNIMIRNPDGSLSPMDEPWYETELIAPGTWRVFSSGDFSYLLAGDGMALLIDTGYPDYFAAGLMVAAPWSAERMAKLTDKTFWILVAEGDSRAYNGMCKVVDALEAAGAQVGRYVWDGHAPKNVLEQQARSAAADGTKIKFTVFAGKSVIPLNDNKGWICHSSTWPLVYSLEGVRDWLTAQRRS